MINSVSSPDSQDTMFYVAGILFFQARPEGPPHTRHTHTHQQDHYVQITSQTHTHHQGSVWCVLTFPLVQLERQPHQHLLNKQAETKTRFPLIGSGIWNLLHVRIRKGSTILYGNQAKRIMQPLHTTHLTAKAQLFWRVRLEHSTHVHPGAGPLNPG